MLNNLTDLNLKHKMELMRSARGFTLIELLVVVAIIAILAVMGIVVFTSVQRNARDARRRLDIDAIAKALEVNKNPVSYVVLNPNQFAGGAIPLTDPQGLPYCGNTTGNTIPGALTGVSNVGGTLTCTPSGVNNYSPISATIPPAGQSWLVCTLLEGGGTFCKSSAQ